MTDGGWDIVGPSAIPFDDGYRTPAALSAEGIAAIQRAFVQSAERADAAGFDMLEVHGAHGYLMHSFHSPVSNQRSDEYGGSFENRIRFTLQTVEAVRAVWPEEKPLVVRISCTDWVEGGWTLEESVELARRLKPLGVDLMDCSSGGGSPKAVVPVGAGYQVPFAEAIRRQANMPTAAVGMITQPQQADQIVRNGQADVVLLAREMLRDPYWPLHAAGQLRHSPAAYAPEPVPARVLAPGPARPWRALAAACRCTASRCSTAAFTVRPKEMMPSSWPPMTSTSPGARSVSLYSRAISCESSGDPYGTAGSVVGKWSLPDARQISGE